MKKITTILLAAAMLTISAVPAFAAEKEPLLISSNSTVSSSAAALSEKINYRIFLNGKDTGSKIRIQIKKSREEQIMMLPMEKTAKALGFTVKISENEITLDSGSMHSTFTIGEDSYQAVTSIEGACGATAPLSLGAASYKEGNTIYVPAELFTILMGNIEDGMTVENDTISFLNELPSEESDTENSNDLENLIIGMANPFTDHDKLADAEAESGVSLTLPEAIVGYKAKDYRAAKDLKMTEVLYFDRTENELRIRKAEGNEDISGDYNDYAEISSHAIDGKAVTMKGHDGKIYLAVWEKDGYSYSVSSDEGFSLAMMSNLVREIR